MKLIDSKPVTTEAGQKVIEFYDNGFIKVDQFCFSSGFRSLVHGRQYLWDYTRTQAQVIEWMFQYLEAQHKSVHQYQLIRNLEDRRFDESDEFVIRNTSLSTRRLRDFFKVPGGRVHPSFGSFLKTTKGRDSKVYFDFSWKPES